MTNDFFDDMFMTEFIFTKCADNIRFCHFKGTISDFRLPGCTLEEIEDRKN